MVCWLAGPDANGGQPRRNGVRCRNLGLKPFSKRIEVTERLEGQIQLLNLWTQSADNIVEPSCDVWIIPKGHLHTHGGCGQPCFPEHAVKIHHRHQLLLVVALLRDLRRYDHLRFPIHRAMWGPNPRQLAPTMATGMESK